MILILCSLYWPMYRAFYKEAIDSFFGEQFKKSHENLRTIIFQFHVSDLDWKKYSKFFYCYTGLGAGCSTKEAIATSLEKHFNENQGNMIIWIPTFILTALPPCWQLAPIMASQHNERCQKITSKWWDDQK